MIEKALKIIKDDMVIEITDKFYCVKGESDIYEVFIDKSKVSCTCRFWSVQGVAKRQLCSHIYAVIGYKMKKGGL